MAIIHAWVSPKSTIFSCVGAVRFDFNIRQIIVWLQPFIIMSMSVVSRIEHHLAMRMYLDFLEANIQKFHDICSKDPFIFVVHSNPLIFYLKP